MELGTTTRTNTKLSVDVHGQAQRWHDSWCLFHAISDGILYRHLQLSPLWASDRALESCASFLPASSPASSSLVGRRRGIAVKLTEQIGQWRAVLSDPLQVTAPRVAHEPSGTNDVNNSDMASLAAAAEVDSWLSSQLTRAADAFGAAVVLLLLRCSSASALL